MDMENFSDGYSPIRYHNITKDDILNGDGLRTVLWVAGCSHCCKGCQNLETWNPDNGLPFTVWEQAELDEAVMKPWIQGITFSGGDPLFCTNRNFISKLAQKYKELGKDIWCYTGYTLLLENNNFILRDEVIGEEFFYPDLKYFDILVDGRFECNTRQKDIESGNNPFWVGSSNQRIIDVQESIKEGTIIVRVYHSDGLFELQPNKGRKEQVCS